MRFACIALSLAAGFHMTYPAWSQPRSGAAEISRESASRTESLRDFEQQIEDAISRRDHAYLDRVTAATFTRTDELGHVEDRATVFAKIRQPPPTADIISRRITRATQQVQLHGDIGVTRSETVVRGPRRAYATTAVKVYRWRRSHWQLLSQTTLSTTPLSP